MGSETRLDSFVTMAKNDLQNERMNRAAVEKAHSARSNRKPGEVFEKHMNN